MEVDDEINSIEEGFGGFRDMDISDSFIPRPVMSIEVLVHTWK